MYSHLCYSPTKTPQFCGIHYMAEYSAKNDHRGVPLIWGLTTEILKLEPDANFIAFLSIHIFDQRSAYLWFLATVSFTAEPLPDVLITLGYRPSNLLCNVPCEFHKSWPNSSLLQITPENNFTHLLKYDPLHWWNTKIFPSCVLVKFTIITHVPWNV